MLTHHSSGSYGRTELHALAGTDSGDGREERQCVLSMDFECEDDLTSAQHLALML